jgi:hypothetical protein
MIYNAELIIPELCPLQFKAEAHGTEKDHYPMAFNYVQKYGLTDTIHVQFQFSEDPTSRNVVINAMDFFTDSKVFDGATALVYSATYTELSAGIWYGDYYIDCSKLSGIAYFTVTDDSGLMADSLAVDVDSHGDTVQIRAHNSRNDFNTVFGAYEDDHVFMIRVEGGFKPNDFELPSDSEMFTNQWQEDTMTFSMPYTVEYLTLGDSCGLPRWLCQKVNYYLACDTVLIDNIQMTKNGNIERSDGVDMKSILRVGMKPTTNRMTQTMTGNIVITNEEGNALTTQTPETLIL